MKYWIFTLGCQMNKCDSERIAAVLDMAGGESVDEADADLIVVNACSVRQTAIDRIWGKLKLWRKWSKKRALKIVLTGCVLPADRDAFSRQFELIFNIKELNKLSEFVGGNVEYSDYLEVAPKVDSKFIAHVPIMTGCDNFCAYCAVPHVRGRECSRPAKEILAEIKRFVASGRRHIVLLGQNVNSYKAPEQNFCSDDNKYTQDFAKLLWEVNKIEGITRLEFSSAHPKDLHDEVIELLALPKMMNYLHLALQAGDDNVLARMNRKYTAADYWNLVEKIRAARPGIHVGTDIIVGFPGETDEQFENTFDFFAKVQFDNAYISKYSPRPNSAAALMPDDVSREEKQRRWDKLHGLFKKIVQARNDCMVGSDVAVLVTKKIGNCWDGYCRENKKVRFFVGDIDLLGQEVRVKITKSLPWGLFGQRMD